MDNTQLKNLKETDLFTWLQSNYYPALQNAKRKMSRWDCYDVPTRNRIELKCRRKHYDTLLIERKKYDAMLTKCKEHGDIPIYINSTPKGIYSFNLLAIKLEWEVNHKNPATTTFGNTNRVAKEVAYININQGVQLL